MKERGVRMLWAGIAVTASLVLGFGVLQLTVSDSSFQLAPQWLPPPLSPTYTCPSGPNGYGILIEEEVPYNTYERISYTIQGQPINDEPGCVRNPLTALPPGMQEFASTTLRTVKTECNEQLASTSPVCLDRCSVSSHSQDGCFGSIGNLRFLGYSKIKIGDVDHYECNYASTVEAWGHGSFNCFREGTGPGFGGPTRE